VVITVMGSLPIHLPVLLFLQSLRAGTVIIFLKTANGMAGVPGRSVGPVRLATVMKIRRPLIHTPIHSQILGRGSSGLNEFFATAQSIFLVMPLHAPHSSLWR
jgi:hypothetical protein